MVYHTYSLDYLHIKVVKGNDLANLIQETHGAGEFQEKMADGRDRNKAITVHEHAVALGCRGDYIEIVCDVTLDGDGVTATADVGTPLKNNGLMVDILDFTGVPVQMQHGGFGRYSKFDTPAEHVTAELKKGVDKQLLTIVPNEVLLNADNAGMNASQIQKVRGSDDGRITLFCDEAVAASVTKVTLKLKPNSDGVFLVPAGAKIWARPNKDLTVNKSFGQVDY